MPPIRSQRGAYTLERMRKLMDYLGNPQNSYKVIHVAGTSGKTSTSYYLAALLKQAGVKVGLSVSPHIDEINERAQIDLKPLSEKRYCKEFSIFIGLVNRSQIKPTYFELLTAFAFWEFERRKCEYAVVEVGLGGLLDATNVISTTNKVCVITDIGFDHEEVLGKTLGLIASQKAGIIKPKNLVVVYKQKDEVMSVLHEVIRQQQASIHDIEPVNIKRSSINLPLFQRRNWYLALNTYDIIKKRDNLPSLNNTQQKLAHSVSIPARMETLFVNDRPLIMDGSHNSQKLHALTASVTQQYPQKRIVALVSFLASKQSKLRQCLEEILPICDQILITRFSTQSGEKVSVDPLKIAEVCEGLGCSSWKIIDNPKIAYNQLLNTNGEVLLITGSFYLLNHIRPLIDSQGGYTSNVTSEDQ